MNRANQQLLFQATNQGLLSIRQSEINYYQSLNVAFGTQAALIGGFTYGVFSQNQINYGNGYASVDVLADVYWILSAITIALSVHVILCTMLMQVLGPGLSLNGPVGSMARATEGMRLEQRQIIVSFIGMMIMFSLSTVLSCWVVMSFEAALGCSISFGVASCYWYYYCERIYLRFYWDSDEAGWKARDNSRDSLDEPTDISEIYQKSAELNPHVAAKIQRRRHGRKGFFSGLFNKKKAENGQRDSTGSDENDPSRAHSISSANAHARSGPMLSKIMARDAELESLESSTDNGSVAGGAPKHPIPLVGLKRGVVLEGYLTKRGGTTQKIDFRSAPWERRYFTLSATCNLFIYKNRHEYRTDPKTPIYTRPLRLQDYYVEVFNMNNPNAGGGIVEDDPANPYRFQMTLVLRENVDNPALSSAPITLTPEGPPSMAGSTLSAAQLGRLRSTSNSPMAAALRQAMYRDHWVLQCDTEEELQLWVHTIRELCPSCFKEI